MGPVLEPAESGELWVADRNFCTRPLSFAMHRKGASFIFPQHSQLAGHLIGGRRRVGKPKWELSTSRRSLCCSIRRNTLCGFTERA